MWHVATAAVQAKDRVRALLSDKWEPFAADGFFLYFRRYEEKTLKECEYCPH